MKNIIIFICSIFFLIACAPKNEVVIDTTQNKTQQNQIITKKNFKLDEEDLDEKFQENRNEKFKVAVVFPSKVVGKYGNSTINTVLSYLFFHNVDFEFEAFDSTDESLDSVYDTFNEVNGKGFNKVIALFTKESLPTINNISSISGMEVYFPLISKEDSFYEDTNQFYFGSISYEDQMKKLLTISTGLNTQFYEESNIGFKLKGIYESLVGEPIVNQRIKQTNNSFKDIVTNELLNDTSLMLNTTIVKSSIILSQLYAYESKYVSVFSTQLNFNPLLISLTQYEDRLNLILANSIEKTDSKLTEILNLLDSDIKYNWVNYSTLVGIDYLYNKNQLGLIKNQIIDNEVIYNTYLYYSTKSNFKKIELN